MTEKKAVTVYLPVPTLQRIDKRADEIGLPRNALICSALYDVATFDKRAKLTGTIRKISMLIDSCNSSAAQSELQCNNSPDEVDAQRADMAAQLYTRFADELRNIHDLLADCL